MPLKGMVSIRMVQLTNGKKDKGLYEIRVKDTGLGMAITKNIIEIMS